MICHTLLVVQFFCLQVKGAIYGCISGLCQSQPEVCGHYVNKMAPLVLHNLDEKDPVIISNLWEAALSLVNYLPVRTMNALYHQDGTTCPP